jgi:hypothetical protein
LRWIHGFQRFYQVSRISSPLRLTIFL